MTHLPIHAAQVRARLSHTPRPDVLDAYGWTDIPTDCEFLLDWEDAEGPVPARRREKSWCLRWPDPVRDEVLARLLALNAERAAEEARAGAVPAKAVPGKGRSKPRSRGPGLLEGLV